MSLARIADAEGPARDAPMRDALALAALARDCVASGVERRALHLPLSRLPAALREPRHRRLLDETIAPLLRPTRARLFELPGGDLVALAPPPGAHLTEVRDALARLLPADFALPLLRLPAEAAALLAAVEAALGLDAAAPPTLRELLPPAEPAALDAALRALAKADVGAHLRRRPICRLAPGTEDAEPEAQEIHVHLADLGALLLPGLDPGPAFRLAAERRMLAGLARPEEARGLGPMCLPLGLATLESPEFLRLEGLLGPRHRTMLAACVPLDEALREPGRFALLRRFAAARGWTLGLDAVPAEALAALPLGRLALPLLRLRFEPALLRAGAEARATLEAGLPEGRETLVLLGADSSAAIAWGWQRGISRFAGRLMRG
jgi:hypothetical protein